MPHVLMSIFVQCFRHVVSISLVSITMISFIISMIGCHFLKNPLTDVIHPF